MIKTSNGWEIATLGDVASIKTGSADNQDKVEGGKYPLFVRSEVIESIDTFSFDCEAILVPGEGGIGSIFHYIEGKFEAHQRVYVIHEFDDSILGKYVYFAMSKLFARQAHKHSVKAAVDSLRLPTFQKFTFPYPKSKTHQRAVVNLLSDFDFTIKTAESLIAARREQKRGLMQKLFSGELDLSELKSIATEVPA